jgi:hypothetical protein
MKLFEKIYDGSSIADVDRDLIEAFDTDFNPAAKDITLDEYNIMRGSFRVTVLWTEDDGNYGEEVNEELQQLNSGQRVVLPKNKEHAENMIRVASFALEQYNKR